MSLLKNILLLFVMSLLMNSTLLAQSKSSIKKNKITTCVSVTSKIENGVQVDKKKVEVFDSKGNTIEESEYINNALDKKETWKFNGNSDPIEHIIYNKDGSVKKKVVKKYNSEGKIIEEIVYGPQDKMIKKEVSTYNGFGEKTEEIIYTADGEIDERHVYKYDNKGLKTERLTYDKKERLIMKRVYTYSFK